MLKRILQRLIYGHLDPAALSPEHARRIRNIFIVVLLMIVVSMPFYVRALQWQIWERVIGISIGLLIAFTLMLGNPQRRHLDWVANLAILCLVSALIPAIMTNGGFTGSAMAWACLLPLFGGFLSGRRAAFAWGLFSILLLSSFLILELQGVVLPDKTPAHSQLSQRFLLYLGAAVSVFLVVISFLTSLNLSDRRFLHLIQQLEHEVQSRKQAEAEALRASEAKTLFLANVSHELRTPMNAIIGMSQLTLDTELSHQQKHQIRVIEQSSQFLLGLINDILDFSQIEADRLKIRQEDFIFDEVIANLATSVAFSAGQKRLSVYFEVDPAIPPCLGGDQLRISQVLMNLFGNAIKFTSRGQIRFIAQCQNCAEDQVILVLFEIQDTGIGMDPDYQKKLFQPFSQADDRISRAYGGTGLGLAICKRLVDLMNGTIEIESTLGIGSKFRVLLPLRKDVPGALTHSYVSRFDQFVQQCAGKRALLKARNPLLNKEVRRQLAAINIEIVAEFQAEFESQTLCVLEGDDSEELLRLTKSHPHLRFLLLCEPHIPLPVKQPQIEILHLPLTRSGLLTALSHLFYLETAASTVTTEASQPLAGRRILLAEDNVINQEVARRILEKYGADVTIANTGKEALERLQQGKFDIILMDIQMPEMDGIEATLEIRTLPHTQHIPILGMSAHVQQSQVATCLQAGMNNCLPKPYRKERLLQAIMDLLENDGATSCPAERDRLPL